MSDESSSDWSPPALHDAARMPESLAGFWARVGAHICDGILLFFITVPFNIIASLLSGASSTFVSLLGVVIPISIYAHWIGTKGGSPWRVRLGILILDKNDMSYIGTRRAVLRILVSYISGLVLLIGYLWMIFDSNNQTWHDKATNTIVVKR